MSAVAGPGDRPQPGRRNRAAATGPSQPGNSGDL